MEDTAQPADAAAQGEASQDWEPGVIPSRTTEWETPFSPVAPATERLDEVRFVATYSPRRRLVAIVATALACGLVALLTFRLFATMPSLNDENGEPSTARMGYILLWRDLFFWIFVLGGVLFMTWRWANSPVVPRQAAR